MLQFLHFSQRFSKQLAALEKADKKGILAAGQTALIIESYRKYGGESPEVRAKRTRHGESRLKNCLKYDLGGGYRLIAIREGQHLFFVCVGSHDDTDLWLEKNRGYGIGHEFQQEFFETVQLAERQSGELAMEEDCGAADSDPGDAYEEDLLSRLDERTLRQLFSGLYNP